jgi:hypothetical protein
MQRNGNAQVQLLLVQGYSNEDKRRMVRPAPIEIDGSERRALG